MKRRLFVVICSLAAVLCACENLFERDIEGKPPVVVVADGPVMAMQASAVVYPAECSHVTEIPFTVTGLDEDGTLSVASSGAVEVNHSFDASKGEGNISVTVKEGFEYGTLVVTATSGGKENKVSCRLSLAFITISSEGAEIGEKGAGATFSVSSNVPYKVTSDVDWITVSNDESSRNIWNAVVAKNVIQEKRAGHIIVSDELELISKTVTYSQTAAKPSDEETWEKIQKKISMFPGTCYKRWNTIDGVERLVELHISRVRSKDAWESSCNADWLAHQNDQDDFGAWCREKIAEKKALYEKYGQEPTELPEEIGQLEYLMSLEIYECPSIIGEIPESIRGLKRLKCLSIFRTNMTGNLPEWLAELPLVYEGWYLTDFIGNRFSGKVPDAVLACSWWDDSNLKQQEGYGLWK